MPSSVAAEYAEWKQLFDQVESALLVNGTARSHSLGRTCFDAAVSELEARRGITRSDRVQYLTVQVRLDVLKHCLLAGATPADAAIEPLVRERYAKTLDRHLKLWAECRPDYSRDLETESLDLISQERPGFMPHSW